MTEPEAATAHLIQKEVSDGVIAPGYTDEALAILKTKKKGGYNIVAIPLAAGVLAAWGILLQPALGAVLMSLSTVVVAINAQLLRRAVRSP